MRLGALGRAALLSVLLVAAACCWGAGTPLVYAPASMGSRPLRLSELEVEVGHIEALGQGALALREPCIRALARDAARQSVSLTFSYLGPSLREEPLGSGELRRQIGIKLRARDTCNVIYVMWHMAPVQGVFVSVKSNPGMHTHDQCRDRGYINLPTQGLSTKVIGTERHTLAAMIVGERLRVLADSKVVWDGALPPEAFAFDGPAGLRSDNGQFDVMVETR